MAFPLSPPLLCGCCCWCCPLPLSSSSCLSPVLCWRPLLLLGLPLFLWLCCSSALRGFFVCLSVFCGGWGWGLGLLPLLCPALFSFCFFFFFFSSLAVFFLLLAVSFFCFFFLSSSSLLLLLLLLSASSPLLFFYFVFSRFCSPPLRVVGLVSLARWGFVSSSQDKLNFVICAILPG